MDAVVPVVFDVLVCATALEVHIDTDEQSRVAGGTENVSEGYRKSNEAAEVARSQGKGSSAVGGAGARSRSGGGEFCKSK